MHRHRTLLSRAIRLHRWLGAFAVVAMLCFAGSGLIHPLMSRTQPQPQSFAPPPLQLPQTPLTLVQALDASAIDILHGATLVQAGDGAAYRVVSTEGSARYLDAANGQTLADAEARHAELLARHFSGEKSAAVIELTQLTQFDGDYLEINRFLPVWRVRFERDDGLTAYVDTEGQRLATLVDNRKRILQNLFRTLHSFNFLEQQPLLRKVLMVGLLIASAATAIAGLIMYVRLRRADLRLKRLPQRRWHRRLALPVSGTLFFFAFSGGWHLLHEADGTTVASPLAPLFKRDELGNQLITTPFALVRVGGTPCYRVALPPMRGGGDHHHHDTVESGLPEIARCFDTRAGSPIAAAELLLAAKLARSYSNASTAPAEIIPVTQFGGEYGFINKRLPVWRVTFHNDATRWYVETGSGALALRADNSDAREGWSFAYLHKWSFVSNKDLRDALLMLFALLHVVMALIGARLLIKRGQLRPATLSTASD